MGWGQPHRAFLEPLCPAAAVGQLRGRDKHPGWDFLLPSQAFLKAPSKMISSWVISAALGCHLLAKAQLSLDSVSFSAEGGFIQIKEPELEGRWVGKKSRGKFLSPYSQCCFSGQDREQHPVQVPKPQGTPFAGTNIPGKVDGKTSISWTGGTNKSFMKRIGNIIARAKRMLICFATWSNGMTGLEGCSHFGGWLLQLIQSINFAALLQAELVPSDIKLSMHLFYQKMCVCVCVWDCLINEFLFNINMQKSLLPQRCVNIYIFLVKEACLWLF